MVVSPPTTDVFIEFLDHLPETSAATATGQFAYAFFETFDRFRVDADTRVTAGTGETESEVFAPPGITNGAFGFINLEFESLGYEASDTCFYAACGVMATNIDDTIVSITHEAVSSTFELV